MSTKQPIWPTGRFGVPQITPFTYRDGHTHLELIEALRDYLVEHLHPSLVATVNSLVEQMETEYGKALDQYVNGVEEFQRIHDRFMSDVVGSLTALNDTAVSDLVDDDTSLLFRVLDREFTTRKRLEQVVVNAADFGATPDSPDSTQGIQDAIDYAHEHGIPRVIVNGTHWIKTHLDGDITGGSPLRQQGGIVLRDNITLDLRGATLKAIPNNVRRYNVVRIDYCDNATVLGGHIQGERHDHTDINGGEWGMGIHIHDSTNVTIKDTLLTDCWGDGIYVAAEPGHYNKNVYIDGVVCRGNRRQGMTVVGGLNIHTVRSVFTETYGTLPESGVDIEPNAPETVCENITFRDCEFTNNAYYGLTAMGGTIRNVTLDGCVVSGNEISAPENGQLRFVRNVAGVVIRDTVVENLSNTVGVELRVHDAILDGCSVDGIVHLVTHGDRSDYTIVNSDIKDRVMCASDMDVKIHHNTLGTRTRDYSAYEADNSVISYVGNMFMSTDLLPVSISTSGTAILHVSNNVFHGYGEYAIGSSTTRHLSVQNNYFNASADSRAGVHLRPGSENSVVSGNSHSGGGALVRFVGDMRNIRVSGNTSDQLTEGSPRSATAENVWIEYSPVEWWHDGEVIHLGDST